jgi:hypothetical protein
MGHMLISAKSRLNIPGADKPIALHLAAFKTDKRWTRAFLIGHASDGRLSIFHFSHVFVENMGKMI